MRESIGASLLLNLVIIFAGLIILFFIGILSYSKAYRIKNRIIEIIEKHETYGESVYSEVNSDLIMGGYNTSNSTSCDSIRERLTTGLNAKYTNLGDNENTYGYNYCVFKSNNANNGYYYVVVTFVEFQVPIIGDLLTFPVYGETKILSKSYDY